MHELATVASSLFTRITRWLVIRNGARYVLAGTIALAGLGAVVSNQGLPKPSAISSILPSGNYDHGHGTWQGWHRRHHLHWGYYEQHRPYSGTVPNGSGSGGNAYIGQRGNGFYGQPGSGFYGQPGGNYYSRPNSDYFGQPGSGN